MRSTSLFSTMVVLFATCLLITPASADKSSDQQIQKDVEKLLQGKKEFQSVTATTDDQIVTLQGTGNLLVDQVNLEERVKRIKRVDGVRNHVTSNSHLPDDKPCEVLSDKLAYDRVGYGVAFNAINLEVKDGVVTLGGNVHDYPSRESAVALAETTPGVKDVIDNIEVAPNSFLDDDLRQKLHRAIYRYPALAALRDQSSQADPDCRGQRARDALRRCGYAARQATSQ